MIGFSLVFAPTVGGVIGNLSNAFFINVNYDECVPELSTTVTQGTVAMFQMMFAAITPLLMTGAYLVALAVICKLSY
jgi:Amt family ammonium transporter